MNIDHKANNKVIEYRNRVKSGEYRWQFGNDVRSVRVREIVDNGQNWTQHTVQFLDGYRDPDHTKTFEMTLNEFANYLAKNDARKHWTCGT